MVPSTGKYWAYRYGQWCKVEVASLPRGGGTGSLIYAPRDRRGYPWHKSAALEDCQAFYGPVAAWGPNAPKVSKKALAFLGIRI